jgi:hypothetical protein
MTYRWKLESHDPEVPEPEGSTHTLQPHGQFVVSRLRDGEALSLYEHQVWDLSPYAGMLCRLSFVPVGTDPKHRKLYSQNVEAFKSICFYFIYGPRKPISPKTLYQLYDTFKRVFDHANEHGVALQRLGRFDRVIASLAERLTPSYARVLPRLLTELHAARDLLGFSVLDYTQIAQLERKLPKALVRQTPYIPQRIYHYHLRRCREMLSEFLSNQSSFEQLFDRCLEEYAAARGRDGIFDPEKQKARPFNPHSDAFCGMTFAQLAAAYGVGVIIQRWASPDLNPDQIRVSSLGKYFGAVQFVGQIHIVSYTGMRIDEAVPLRTGCMIHEKDKYLGDIYLIAGATTKTDPDDDARWVTSLAASDAIEAMSAVARLRLKAAVLDPGLSAHDLDDESARLYSRGYEPWHAGRRPDTDPERRVHRTMDGWRARCPGLYDIAQLTISAADQAEALALTPTLDLEKFAVGKAWTFAFHQLRRTLTCNAAASGLVTLPALQYQMKHQHEAMTRYYARNYSALRMNESLCKDFAEEIIDALVRDALQLSQDRYVSPHGEAHKAAKLRFLPLGDETALRRRAKQGKVAMRHNALGVCLFAGECEYGGIDSIASCVDCSDVLVDSSRRAKFDSLLEVLEDELWDSDGDESQEVRSRRSQLTAMRRVVDVVLV